MPYDVIEEVNKFNPYHDAKGRFASSPGGTVSTSDLARTNVLAKYPYIGVRTLTPDEKYAVGDTCRDSYDWDPEWDRSTYDTDNPISLGGTCSIGIKWDRAWDDQDELETALNDAMKMSDAYEGERKVIIGGKSQRGGNDPVESIISDAEVLAVYDPKSGKWITTPPKKASKQTKERKPKPKAEKKPTGPKITSDDVERYKEKLEADYMAAHPGTNRYAVFPNLPFDQRKKITALRNYASQGDARWLEGLDLSDVPIGKSHHEHIDYIIEAGETKV